MSTAHHAVPHSSVYEETAPEVNPLVAAEVRAAMGRQKRTQTWVAAQIGMSQPTFSRRLSGEVAFDVVELVLIARALKTTVPTLVSRSRCSAQLSSVPLPEGLKDQLSWLDERGEPWEPPSVAAV